jgi:hypothetical protein
MEIGVGTREELALPASGYCTLPGQVAVYKFNLCLSVMGSDE